MIPRAPTAAMVAAAKSAVSGFPRDSAIEAMWQAMWDAASVGRSGNRQDRETGLGPKDEHAVAATSAETPTPSPAIDQDGGE